MLDSDVESRWYAALLEEDCLRVMALLKEHPILLKEGWDGDSSRLVEGSRLNYWMPRTKRKWFGRTALHVGARRGCTELLDQVIQLCYVSKMDPKRYVGSSDDETELSSTSDEEGSPETADLADSERAERKGNLNINAGSDSVAPEDIHVAEGGGHEYRQGWSPPEPPSRSSKIRSKREGEDRKPGRAVSMDRSKLETSSDDKKLGSARSTATSSRKLKAGDRKLSRRRSVAHSKREVHDDRKLDVAWSLMMTGLKRDGDGDVESGSLEEDLSSGVSVSLDNLLLVRDGEYKLDALAMAVLNGNLDVLTILLKASVNCKAVASRYEIHGPPLSESLVTIQKRREEEDERERYRKEQREQLRKVTREVIDRFSGDRYFLATCLKGYEKHRDFNFLPREEYLFHFLFVDFEKIPDEMGRIGRNYSRSKRERVLRKVVIDMREMFIQFAPSLWSYLWELQDGQGRPPLHVAVDEGTVTRCRRSVFDNLEGDDVVTKMLNTCDGGGRTALHRLVTLGIPDNDASPGTEYLKVRRAARQLLSVCSNEMNFAPKLLGKVPPSPLDELTSRINISFSLGALSTAHGFMGIHFTDRDDQLWSTHRAAPIHSAIIHKRPEILLYLLRDFVRWIFSPIILDDAAYHTQTSKLLRTPLEFQISAPHRNFRFQLDCVELAALVGEKNAVFTLMNGIEGKQPKAVSEEDRFDAELSTVFTTTRNPWPALHLAAGLGKYEILKTLIDNDYCDPFMEDIGGSSPLHHATKGCPIQFDTQLLDYVNCQQILDSQQQRERDIEECYNRRILNLNNHRRHAPIKFFRDIDDFVVEREGCINLLVQHGCDIFKTNASKEAPDAESGMDGKFLSWWYEKQAREFGSVQNTFGVVANAISVTAALVATASYVGPLQPPLGYGTDSNGDAIGIRLNFTWVRIFTACDTMSFYLAIATIICSFIPSLPMPQQSMSDELRRTRRMLTMAVTMLFPSVIFVLVAFASSSIAVIRANSGLWNHEGLPITLATACIGGLVCFVTIILFFMRLIGFIFYKIPWIRKAYNVTSF